jgi:hypothetical protein
VLICCRLESRAPSPQGCLNVCRFANDVAITWWDYLVSADDDGRLGVSQTQFLQGEHSCHKRYCVERKCTKRRMCAETRVMMWRCSASQGSQISQKRNLAIPKQHTCEPPNGIMRGICDEMLAKDVRDLAGAGWSSIVAGSWMRLRWMYLKISSTTSPTKLSRS